MNRRPTAPVPQAAPQPVAGFPLAAGAYPVEAAPLTDAAARRQSFSRMSLRAIYTAARNAIAGFLMGLAFGAALFLPAVIGG